MATLEVDNQPPFLREEWIGWDKHFVQADLLLFVLNAQAKAFVLSTRDCTRHLPNPTSSVSEFISLTLPPIDPSTFLVHAASEWFSSDPPNQVLDVLHQRTVPCPRVLETLMEKKRQLWLDGAQSIRDLRQDGSPAERLPLSALSLWTELAAVIEFQRSWRSCQTWLSALIKATKDIDTRTNVEATLGAFPSLPWNGEVRIGRTSVKTTELTRFSGNGWLSGDLLDVMVEALPKRWEDGVQPLEAVYIGDRAVLMEIARGRNQKDFTKKYVPLLHRIEDGFRSGRYKHAYFPGWAHKNHWVVFHVDYEKAIVEYEDSLRGTLYAMTPKTEIAAILLWLKTRFGNTFRSRGLGTMQLTQPDLNSCGLFAISILAHTGYGRPLLTSIDNIEHERAKWFSTLAECVVAPPQAQDSSAMREVVRPHITNLLNASDSELSISDLTVDAPRQPAPEPHWREIPDVTSLPAVASESDGCPSSPPRSSSLISLPSFPSSPISVASGSAAVSPLSSVADRSSGSLPWSDNDVPLSPLMLPEPSLPSHHASPELPDEIAANLPSLHDCLTASSTDLPPPLKLAPIFLKGHQPSSSGPSKRKREGEDRQKGKKSKSSADRPQGQSQSAIASRRARALLKDGEFEWSDKKLRNWRFKIWDIDEGAVFSDDNKMICCSKCAKWYKPKEPYDVTRFREHYISCKGTRRPTMHELADLYGWTFREFSRSDSTEKGASDDAELHPCRGVSEEDNEHIGVYIRRTGAVGGGGRSIVAIAKEKLKKTFSKLTRQQKVTVIDAQISEHKWRNDFRRARVYSTTCARTVSDPTRPCSDCHSLLRDDRFRRAIKKPMPSDKNYAFINHMYRDKHLGELYAKSQGLLDLLKSASEHNASPFVRYAVGVVDGKYSDSALLGGLLESVMIQEDKNLRGVGMQNFRWPVEYDRFLHLLFVESPRGYRLLQQYLPARSERSFRAIEAKQPSVPFTITERTFDLVHQHILALDYPGLLALSCDDSKLLPSWRLYYDSEEKTHFLVGGTDGPLRVPDPTQVRKIIEDPTLHKATKLRLWCLQVPLPKVSPIIVAALAIPNNLNAAELLVFSEQILHGLLARDLHIVSCAHDGTEIERSVQRLLASHADGYREYSIPSPSTPLYDVSVAVPLFADQPVICVQDSMHGRKTLRNNMFSGGRYLVMGTRTVLYHRIRRMAFEDGSPLYHRDVEKLDRQDDNAAIRLFSSAALEHHVTHHPDDIGESVYLTVYGRLIDAWQNHVDSHAERLRAALCAYYFQLMWETYLERTGYPLNKYCLSREARDIVRILVRSLFSLTMVHHDYCHLQSRPFPFLPWLHSTEGCEHVFGQARSVVKDFTYLDFHQMVSKLYLKLREAVKLGRAGDAKGTAKGYNHTYLDSRGIDLAALSTYPDDAEVQTISVEAFAEAESFIALLGISPNRLHIPDPQPVPQPGENIPPTTDDTESDDEDDGEEDESDAAQLQAIIEQEDNDGPMGRTAKEDDRADALTVAALSVSMDFMCRIAELPELDPDTQEEIWAESCAYIGASLAEAAQAHPRILKAVGDCRPTLSQLNLHALVQLRRDHETRQAREGVRTRRSQTDSASVDDSELEAEKSLHRLILVLEEYYKVNREKAEERGVGTGKERGERWRAREGGGGGDQSAKKHEPPPQPEAMTGNSLNAARVAASVATSAATKRKKCFKEAGIPVELVEHLGSARISKIRPLNRDDFAFVFLDGAVMLAQIECLYSKSVGKQSKHADIDSCTNISAVSNVGVRLFEYMHATHFQVRLNQFNIAQYKLLKSTSVLFVLTSRPVFRAGMVVLSEGDAALFRDMRGQSKRIATAQVSINKREKQAKQAELVA